MRKTFYKTAALVILIQFMGYVSAQSVSAEATSTADIVPAIQVTNNVDLHFGDIMPHYFHPDVVRINLSGENRISVLGWSILLPSDDGQPAEFTVTGGPGRLFTITLPGNYEVYLSRDLGGGTDMRLENFVSDPSGFSSFDGTGSCELRIGAQLVVGANQLEGWYSGTYDIILEYF